MKKQTLLHNIPSFYGSISFGACLVLYLCRFIPYNKVSSTTLIILVGYEFACIFSTFFVATILQKYWFKKNASGNHTDNYPFSEKKDLYLTLLFHILGISGMAIYIADRSSALGGVIPFFYVLMESSYEIRWLADESNSLGTQISYFGWIGIGSSIYYIMCAKKSIKLLASLSILQLLLNLLYIDRTRPLWIIFTSLLTIISFQKKISVRKIFISTSLFGFLSIFLFICIGVWIGKVSADSDAINRYDSFLPTQLEDAYFYITSGCAYFNELIEHTDEIDFTLTRTFYPLLKFGSMIGVSQPPPAQVLDYYNTPYPTNVGTFLEPFFRDGGMLYVVISIFIYTIMLDLVAVFFLNKRTALSIFAWSNLCFCSFISFFVPKLSSFPCWLFVILAIFSSGNSKKLQSKATVKQ